MMQCLIFDSNMPTAKLIGVEYVISEKLFLTLPETERVLWHSHAFEAQNGLIVAPGLPQAVEAGYVQVCFFFFVFHVASPNKEWARTYGKNWHFWHLDRNPDIPMGAPQLMMAPVRPEDVDLSKLIHPS